jgi:uncharacterized protein (TIGR02453 family)
MFQGYNDETFEFFMAIRFNNNTDFFHANHDWYKSAVREPSLALAEALGPTIEWIDDSFERRPNRVVSRINRDIRFSNDKSPYRDYMWLAFRQPGLDRKTTLGAYFDISCQGASYGFGIYNEHRPYMNGLRQRLATDEENFLNVWLPVKDRFELCGNRFKRMAIPDGLSPEAAQWYTLKGFYVEKDLPDFDLLMSPALVDEIRSGFEALTPLYQYLKDVPEIDVP